MLVLLSLGIPEFAEQLERSRVAASKSWLCRLLDIALVLSNSCIKGPAIS